jgi:hypothetical protein
MPVIDLIRRHCGERRRRRGYIVTNSWKWYDNVLSKVNIISRGSGYRIPAEEITQIGYDGAVRRVRVIKAGS